MPKRKNDCHGCAYWRSMAYGGYRQSGEIHCCHYMLDTGKSRLKLCGDGECTVRKERDGSGQKKSAPKGAGRARSRLDLASAIM